MLFSTPSVLTNLKEDRPCSTFALLSNPVFLLPWEVAMSDHWTRSFIASLHSVTPGHRGRIGISLVEGGIADDGWLRVAAETEHTKPVNFRFDYLSHSTQDNRIHYNITCTSETGSYRGARLGVSLNGYLGLYQVAQVSDFWKTSPLGEWVVEEDAQLEFMLRDHRGYRVGQMQLYPDMELDPRYNPRYLSVSEGEVLQFKAKVLLVLEPGA